MKPERAQKIDQITSSALELPPEHRAQFLANTCADDSDLRKEVESRVERHEPGQRRQVGEYRIQKLLGAGGMGEVYLAIDRMGRRVALKLLAPKAAKSRQHVARFSQEAQTLLALNHPNIVTIYNVGESEGTCYIASGLI